MPCIKIPSACLTDRELLEHCRSTGVPLILSTGMSTFDQIDAAVSILGTERLLLAHCTSAYPCANEELNLRVIPKLRELYPCPVGYSGHELGLATSLAAVALGASFVERHITLDRAMWGSDQAASVEPVGMGRLIKDIQALTQHSAMESRKFMRANEKPRAASASETPCDIRRTTCTTPRSSSGNRHVDKHFEQESSRTRNS